MPKFLKLNSVILGLSVILVSFFLIINLKSNQTDYSRADPLNIPKKIDTAGVVAKPKTKLISVPNPANDPFLSTLIKENLPANIAQLKVTQLNVPFFKQQYIRSCEEASLRMVLAFYGIATNDMEIVQKIGYNPRAWDYTNNIWDDPSEMFVGFIDAANKSGYGTFAPAIEKGAKMYGRDAGSYSKITAQFIGQQIHDGHPVIVWGFYDAPPFIKYSWKTDKGKTIAAYRGEHARVVTGLVGDPNNPVGFFLNDPQSDQANEYWSASRLMKHMNMLGSLTNQAVVVY